MTYLKFIALVSISSAFADNLTKIKREDLVEVPEKPQEGFLQRNHTKKKHRRHPTVQTNANQVDLDFLMDSDYLGHLYVGQDYLSDEYVIYDTRTKWTGVNHRTVEGGSLPASMYDPMDSNTSEPVNPDPSTGTPQPLTLKLDDNLFDGNLYKDQMCLY